MKQIFVYGCNDSNYLYFNSVLIVTLSTKIKMYLNSATNWFFGVGDSQRRSSAKDQLLEASVLTELVICQGMNTCISHN